MGFGAAAVLGLAVMVASAATPLAVEPAPVPPATALDCTFEEGGGVRAMLCTHGADPVSGVASRIPPLVEATEAAPVSALPCYGDGQSGNRVQAVYARPADQPDRYSQVVGSIGQWAWEVDNVISASARMTGGIRHVRYVTTPDCVLDVLRVVISPLGDDTFAATVAELRAQGLTRSDRKYLVWMESDAMCGIANFYLDDRPTQDNANNGRIGLEGTIARIDRGCWGLGSRGQSVEAHELTHSLGAVQTSAPHSTALAHCTDDADRMCYADGTPGAQVSEVCGTRFEALLDCGHDDYFHTNPPGGSYLATHWNAADSSFLATSEPPPPPAGVLARIAGTDRIATSIAASRDAFPSEGSARAAVIANAVRYPDALAGVPLAARRGGPLLLNGADALDERVLRELQRVVEPDGSIFVLGGTAAISERVRSSLEQAGYQTVRYGGANRYETAVAIAEDGLDAPQVVLEATGQSFADALPAGAAAAAVQGAVLLTNGPAQAPETAAYFVRHPATRRYALGGPAAAADPAAEPIAGTDRYHTSALVAARFFPTPRTAGVASGVTFPDALSGGANIATRVAPILLTTPRPPIPTPVRDFIREHESLEKAIVYGGRVSVDDGVAAAIARVIAPQAGE